MTCVYGGGLHQVQIGIVETQTGKTDVPTQQSQQIQPRLNGFGVGKGLNASARVFVDGHLIQRDARAVA